MTEDRIDLYVREELTPEQSRKLAQDALDDSELFDELTYSALAKAAVSSRPAPRVVSFPRRVRFWAVGAAAAATILAVYIYRPVRVEKPALVSSATRYQPILLARSLQPAAARPDVFRGADPDSREPRTTGSIASIEDGVAAIDLGSLDGVAKGSELNVIRAEHVAGRVVVTTVFRERARAQVVSGQVRRGDAVRVPPAAHLNALLEQVDALSARGDSAGARKSAEKSVAWAINTKISPGEALERLASLEYHAGMLQNAEQHYQAAETAAAFNALAVLRILRGDYSGAAQPLAAAISKSTRGDVLYARGMNNLGVLTEVRGDRKKAADLYGEASRVFAASHDASDEERRAAETNFARVRGSH